MADTDYSERVALEFYDVVTTRWQWLRSAGMDILIISVWFLLQRASDTFQGMLPLSPETASLSYVLQILMFVSTGFTLMVMLISDIFSMLAGFIRTLRLLKTEFIVIRGRRQLDRG